MLTRGFDRPDSGRTGDGQFIKSVNRNIILEEIVRRGRVSRASIAKETGLNKATVSAQVAELLAAGIVVETGTGSSEGGRRPVILELDGSAGAAVGLGLSAGLLRLVARDLAGRELFRSARALAGADPETVLAAMTAAVEECAAALPASRFGLLGIGLALPGVVDARSGRLLRSAHLDWTNVDLKDRFEARFGCPVTVGNDAKLAAAAEFAAGQGAAAIGESLPSAPREAGAGDARPESPATGDALCLLVDEGIGAGAVMEGRVYSGPRGAFGEAGHMTLIHGGRPCSCGNRGCWDAYASEKALAARVEEAAPGMSLEKAVAAAVAGDPRLVPVFDDFADYLASGLVSLANLFSPDFIVVNSSVLSAHPACFDRLLAALEGRMMPYNRGCAIRLSALGKDAPALGAAMAAAAGFLEAAVRDLSSLAGGRRGRAPGLTPPWRAP